jgi:hypothetical protein
MSLVRPPLVRDFAVGELYSLSMTHEPRLLLILSSRLEEGDYKGRPAKLFYLTYLNEEGHLCEDCFGWGSPLHKGLVRVSAR